MSTLIDDQTGQTSLNALVKEKLRHVFSDAQTHGDYFILGNLLSKRNRKACFEISRACDKPSNPLEFLGLSINPSRPLPSIDIQADREGQSSAGSCACGRERRAPNFIYF